MPPIKFHFVSEFRLSMARTRCSEFDPAQHVRGARIDDFDFFKTHRRKHSAIYTIAGGDERTNGQTDRNSQRYRRRNETDLHNTLTAKPSRVHTASTGESESVIDFFLCFFTAFCYSIFFCHPFRFVPYRHMLPLAAFSFSATLDRFSICQSSHFQIERLHEMRIRAIYVLFILFLVDAYKENCLLVV